MEKQLYKEVSKVVGTTLEKVSNIEVATAKQDYIKTGECKHEYVYDESGFMYDNRYCGICGKHLDLI